MAVFEKGPAARRFYSFPSDPFPTAEAGIPTGSFLTYVGNEPGTGDRFIYHQPSDTWIPYIGEEDLWATLVEIRDSIQEQLPVLQLIQEATAAVANELTECFFPTGDE